MEQTKRKPRGKLLSDYILILLAVGVCMLISFFATNTFVMDTARNQSRQAADVIFEQANDQVGIFEEDISNLYLNVIQNVSVSNFFTAEDFAGRWNNLDGFLQMVGNNMRINTSLENIMFTDADGNLIASKGDIFVSAQWKPEDLKGVTYSDRLYDAQHNEFFFQVGAPMYIDQVGSSQVGVGSVYLLFNTGYLQTIVDGALPNEDAAVGILVAGDALIGGSGKWEQKYGAEWKTREDDDLLVYVSAVGYTGWRMVSVVPKSSLLSGVTQMQQISFVTLGVALLALIFVCSLIYLRIIKPIARQTAFMASFTQDTRQRIEVTENNEIGEMAQKMNEMLDSIETLNREKLEVQKRNMQLEVEKKQTELIAYRSQINPHFLSNAFNCIRGIALYHGEKEIAELSMALTRFFRYSVQKEEIVTVGEALEGLGYYAQIIQYRFNGRHQVELCAADDVREERIPKMLIQPIVENAVFHGLETLTGSGVVTVTVRRDEKNLLLTVADTGGGMDVKTEQSLRQAMQAYDRKQKIPEDSPGIGFMNVYRRLRLFYGNSAVFRMKNEQGKGLEIRMELPLSAFPRKNKSGQEKKTC